MPQRDDDEAADVPRDSRVSFDPVVPRWLTTLRVAFYLVAGLGLLAIVATELANGHAYGGRGWHVIEWRSSPGLFAGAVAIKASFSGLLLWRSACQLRILTRR